MGYSNGYPIYVPFQNCLPLPHCSSGCLLHIQSCPGPSCLPKPPAVSISLGEKGSDTASVVNMCSSSSGALVPLTDVETPALTTSGPPRSTIPWGMGPGFPTGWPGAAPHNLETPHLRPWGDLGQWETGHERQLEDDPCLSCPWRTAVRYSGAKALSAGQYKPRRNQWVLLRGKGQPGTRLSCVCCACLMSSLLLSETLPPHKALLSEFFLRLCFLENSS